MKLLRLIKLLPQAIKAFWSAFEYERKFENDMKRKGLKKFLEDRREKNNKLQRQKSNDGRGEKNAR